MVVRIRETNGKFVLTMKASLSESLLEKNKTLTTKKLN